MKRSKIRRGGLAPDKYLSDEQLSRLFAYLTKKTANRSRRAKTNEFIIIMLLYSGLRANEFLRLLIRDTPYHHGKNVIDVRNGKGGIDRSVEIPSQLSEKIKEFVGKYRQSAKPGSPVITSEGGFRRFTDKTVERSARMIYHSLYYRLRAIGQASGVGRLTPHMLRHTYACGLYKTKQDLLFVQDQLGHADPQTTAIYAKTSSTSRREQVESLVNFQGNESKPNVSDGQQT